MQNAWGDSGLSKDRIVAALLEDSPAIGNLYEQHQTDTGGLSFEGVQAVYQHLIDNSSYKTSEALEQANPELIALFYDHVDESCAIPPAAVKILLAHIAGKSGYRHVYRAKR